MDSQDKPPVGNIYEGGKGDARQTTRDHLQASEVLFRPRYRRLSEQEIDLHDRIKTQAAVLAALFYEVEPIHAGPSRNRERGANVQLAIRNLEDAVYRAVKGLTGPTAESEKSAADEVRAKLKTIEQEHEKAKSAAADRKPGVDDLPADQQKQLGEGKPIGPQPDPGSQRPVETTEAARVRDFILIGSDAFDSVIDIGGPVQLGQIVADAVQRSGVTAEEWNGLPQDVRDGAIRQEIELQRANVAAAAARDALDPAAAADAGIACSEGLGGASDDPHRPLTLSGDRVLGFAGAKTAAPARPVENDGGRGSSADTAVVSGGPATGPASGGSQA